MCSSLTKPDASWETRFCIIPSERNRTREDVSVTKINFVRNR